MTEHNKAEEMAEILSEQMAEQIEAGQEALHETTGLLADMWQKLMDYMPTIIIALFVFLIGMLIAGIINKVISHTMKKAKITATASSFGHSLVRIILHSFVIIISLSILGVPMASIIAVIGTAGVTIGLAMQNSLSNLAGGFVILFAKPFQRGDYIIAAGEEGFVESVTTLYTELITLDNRCIYLPNSIVSGGAVENLSRNGKLRVSVPVSVSYRTNLIEAKQVLLQTIKKVPTVLRDPEPFITVKELADSGIVMMMNVWVNKSDYFLAPSHILEAVKPALHNAGIEIPFPQLDVHTKYVRK